MKLEQPKEFLDLCDKLKEINIESLVWCVKGHFNLHTRNIKSVYGRAFEELVACALDRLYEDSGASLLQDSDKRLFLPYETLFEKLNCKLFQNNKQITELDHVLRFGEDQLWIFEDTVSDNHGVMSNYRMGIFDEIAKNGTKIAYAFITTKDRYEKIMDNAQKYPIISKNLGESGVTLTYLPINFIDIRKTIKLIKRSREKS